ncbi:MAG: phosphatidate cytidylyltransferase [Clostridiales bacterium]|jgi:phosphatidate cytidylyltransferase|nr:phosphatidate cytidylyltransferase [Clostridiales bacterium]
MKIRLIAAAVGAAALVLIIVFAPAAALAALIALLSGAALLELGRATGAAKYLFPYGVSVLFAILVPLWAFFEQNTLFAQIGLILYTLIQFSWLMLRAQKVRFEELSGQLFASLLIPLSLLSLLSLLKMGRAYLLLPFVIALASDTGAYFAGTYLGKHRAAGNISPDKTYEGFIGGLLGALVITAVYSVIMLLLYRTVSWLGIIAYGILGSAIGQFGDMVFSYIKRQYNTKTFGKLLPGHGGVLDRLDSVIFCAPFVLLLLTVIPLFE